LYGGKGNDLIYGSHKVTGKDYKLFGDAGDDKIIGGDAIAATVSDSLYGMDGNDQIYGGDKTSAVT
jgi:Ca2+-binding RTX toxin-like protein